LPGGISGSKLKAKGEKTKKGVYASFLIMMIMMMMIF